jgi:hypothetical protein
MAALPYITSPATVGRALRGIKTAATPARISQDFVKTILQIPGGLGNQITAYLRKIGFAGSDGAPTALYTKFRNSATEGQAVAEALKVGYGPLYVRNEYMHRLSDADLRGLVIEETGAGEDSTVADRVVGCIKQLKGFARWDAASAIEAPASAQLATVGAPQAPSESPPHAPEHRRGRQVQMNLSYTINLNLPATTDTAVFSAIFKSLKEHLLKDSDE